MIINIILTYVLRNTLFSQVLCQFGVIFVPGDILSPELVQCRTPPITTIDDYNNTVSVRFDVILDGRSVTSLLLKEDDNNDEVEVEDDDNTTVATNLPILLTYEYVKSPMVLALIPQVGVLTGGTVVGVKIRGGEFLVKVAANSDGDINSDVNGDVNGDTSPIVCFFGTISSVATVVNATYVTCTTPSTTIAGDVLFHLEVHNANLHNSAFNTG